MASASERIRLSLGIGIAVYAAGLASALAVGTWLAGWVLEAGLAPPPDRAPRREGPVGVSAAMSVPPAAPQSVRRQGAMTTLADQWDGRWNGRYSRPPPRAWGANMMPSGTFVRRPYRHDDDERPFDADDDEDARQTMPTFRTVCVRLCDGYYFPISFAVGANRLEHDSRVCESRCGAQGRLFLHANPGGSTDDLYDLTGRPYRQLRTAFLYRTQYIASCTCQPHPWEQVSLDRHRAYALAAAAGKGSREAAKELQGLQAKLREGAKGANKLRPPAAASAGEIWQSAADLAGRAAPVARREDGGYMGLGGKSAPAPKAEPPPIKSGSDPDWLRRVFDPGALR
jgi:Protein of unknown function (DUF2865)